MTLLLLSTTGAPDAPAATTSVAAPKTASSSSWRLDELRRRFDNNECDKLVVDADVVAHDVTLSDADHRDVEFMEAYCDVVGGNDTAATKIFETLVHEDVDYKPSFPIETRISDRLEGARAREKKARDDAAAAARKKLTDSVKLTVHPPLNLAGGQRAVFTVDVVDPEHVVRSMRLDFVKEGEREPYGIPVLRQPDGTWRAEIAGSYTRTKKTIHIRWFVTASDDVGEIAAVGTKAKPETLDIIEGADVALDLKGTERLSKTTRFLYAAVGAPAIAGAGFATAAAASEIFSHRVLVSGPKNDGELAPWIGVALVGAVPPIVGVIGEAVGTQFLLDGDEVWIPTGVLAVTGLFWFAGVMYGGPQLIRDAFGFGAPPGVGVNDVCTDTKYSTANRDQCNRSNIGFGVAVVGAALGLAAASVTPATIVTIDNVHQDITDYAPTPTPPATTTTTMPATATP